MRHVAKGGMCSTENSLNPGQKKPRTSRQQSSWAAHRVLNAGERLCISFPVSAEPLLLQCVASSKFDHFGESRILRCAARHVCMCGFVRPCIVLVRKSISIQ
jgi:hypothetical protein